MRNKTLKLPAIFFGGRENDGKVMCVVAGEVWALLFGRKKRERLGRAPAFSLLA